ncbi:MAG: VanZ family protein [Gammaproteobacteria bacterium]
MQKTLTHRFWLAVGWLLVAFVIWITLTPSPPSELQTIPHLDKTGHFLAYVALTAWFTAALPGRKWLTALTVTFIIMGGVLEILQGFTGRDPSWFDWLIDSGGALLGAGLPRIWLTQIYAWLKAHEQRLASKSAAG